MTLKAILPINLFCYVETVNSAKREEDADDNDVDVHPHPDRWHLEESKTPSTALFSSLLFASYLNSI